MLKDPLVIYICIYLIYMSDQTNAVKVDIGTGNHFVNIFLFVIIFVAMNNLICNIYSPLNLIYPPPYNMNKSVQSDKTFTFTRRS